MMSSSTGLKSYGNMEKIVNGKDKQYEFSLKQRKELRPERHYLYNQEPNHSRNFFTLRYSSFFYDHCFSCHNFSHKPIHCIPCKTIDARKFEFSYYVQFHEPAILRIPKTLHKIDYSSSQLLQSYKYIH